MPANLFCNPNTSRKSLKLTFLFLLSPLFFYAQSLTGLWVGSISNDSNTVRKDQSFEIALTEYRGKVYGYSRSEFIVDDVLYNIVKRVKGTIVGDVCEVTDDEIISYNFPGKPDKNVKVISIFRRDKSDSAWHLDGKWKTNATKKYYSVTGKVALQQEADLSVSKIFPHLEELKLSDQVVFYKERKEGEPIVKIAKPEKIQTNYSTGAEKLSAEKNIAAASNTTIIPGAAPNIIAAKPTFSSGPSVTNDVVKNNSQEIKNTTLEKKQTEGQPDISSTKPVVNKTNNTTTPIEKKNEVKAAVIAKSAPKQDVPATKPKQQTTVTQPEVIAKNPEPVKAETLVKIAAVEKKEPAPALLITDIKKPEVDITLKSASIAGRKSEFSQAVNFKSDSLQISLYDNGEIDGDTVSVFMNGEIILARQGLKSSAIRKTIYLTPGQNDEFTLVMFAESLGKYPPNTGLLVIRDGNDVYNLRFSSDFQKNAGIVFKRKK